MSFQAMTWATAQRVGDCSLKLLLLTLSNYANEEGECWHSQKRISFDTEIPERTLRRKLSRLVEAGFIQITERRRYDGSRATSLVRILFDQAAKMADCETAQDLLEESTSGQNSKRPKTGVTSGQKRGSQAANMVAGAVNCKEPSRTSNNNTPGSDDWPADHVEIFWNEYPPYRRSAKKTVAAKLAAIRKSGLSFATLMAGLRRYVTTNPGEFAKGPVVWLNGGCWDDNLPPRVERRPTQSRNGFAALLLEHRREQQNQSEDYHHGEFVIDGEFVSDRAGHHRRSDC